MCTFWGSGGGPPENRGPGGIPFHGGKWGFGPFLGVLGSVFWDILGMNKILWVFGGYPPKPRKKGQKGPFLGFVYYDKENGPKSKMGHFGGSRGGPGGPPRGAPPGGNFPAGPPGPGAPQGGSRGGPPPGPSGGSINRSGVCHCRCDDQRLTPLIIALPCRSLARATGLALTLACQHQR